MNNWYAIRHVRTTGGTLNEYRAMYKRGINGTWHVYADPTARTWEGAYKTLERHANPAALAVRFVGTF